ncbi:MAG: adenylosuccinate synthetase [Anaerolineae bacterium]|nr:adenylosuccinate synthetase [Anaerolineae bacterium]
MVVVDLGFGDAGKGSVIDFLARRTAAHTVIRFNGGAQAAHNVITPDGRHHTFAQFGSATFLPGVQTYLSRYMLVEPYALFNEEQHLAALGVTDALDRLSIDRRALIITPFHQAANRLKELARGANRHGSCGLGIGETMADALADPSLALYAGDLPQRAAVMRRLQQVRDQKFSEIEPLLPALRELESDDERATVQQALQLFDPGDLIEIVAENYVYLAERVTLVDDADWAVRLRQPGTILFEGAQGVLLDENYGFAPYTTWSTTTCANADALLNQAAYAGEIVRLGLWRAYFTRHGPGPFVTEDRALNEVLPEPHNGDSLWQRHFRRGYFDRVAARYALDVAGHIDELAITHLDAALPRPQWCYAYTSTQPDLDPFFDLSVDHNQQVIKRIKVLPQPAQAHQTQLSQHLFHCQPLYEAIPDNTDDWLSALADWSGLPVTLTSWGPTANDKRVRCREQ